MPGFVAVTLGGKVTAPSEVDPFAKPLHFTTDLKLEGASVQQLIQAIGGEEKHADAGSLLVTFKGGGEASLAGIKGGGQIQLSAGDLVSVPVLGKLAPLFTRIVSAFLGGTSGSNVSCDYQLNESVFTSNDIRLRKSAFEVAATAVLNFSTRELHATAAVETVGISKVVTAPLGKVLQLEASGGFVDYTWRFKNLPGVETIADVGKLIGGAVEKQVEAGEKAAAGGVEAVAKDTGEAAAAAGRGVKKTLEELEKLDPIKK